MTNKGKLVLSVLAAVLIALIIIFWGSVFGGICVLALGAIPVTLIKKWHNEQGDPSSYFDGTEDEK